MSARTRKTQACEKKFVGSRKTERLGENRLGLRVEGGHRKLAGRAMVKR
jgi:hypothetical protein